MYALLLPLHSAIRWLVLISLLFAIFRAFRGWKRDLPFTKFDNFKEAIHERQIRFFGMEHITVMFIYIVIITLGSIKTKK